MFYTLKSPDVMASRYQPNSVTNLPAAQLDQQRSQGILFLHFIRDRDAGKAMHLSSVQLSYLASRTPIKQHESAPYSFVSFVQNEHTSQEGEDTYLMLVSADLHLSDTLRSSSSSNGIAHSSRQLKATLAEYTGPSYHLAALPDVRSVNLVPASRG
ncbi:hypothetical protein CONLIGDRAFT_687673 [Coniochaeta ligniaria NRRL 30616]|uniref:Uncharacterized protein n=1 Tax=Coniochaeta ligniaria NRRL 30616 TaxID=1408157 RepID=A0A1J7I462_9PEZI|nr:hypothetical protein CONLIGDRAFT_687673 [Coniochaeta ligniaria NRRL 30616]